MKIVSINSKYLEYLKNFSINIKDNKTTLRPYIGIVLRIEGHIYYAPLGSPKVKHLNMKENIDFLKIKNGELGVINLNNMIPVLIEDIIEFNFNLYGKKYKELLKDQSRWIAENEKKIIKNATKLYKLIVEKEGTMFHKRSNDFKLLEEKAKEWSLNRKLDFTKERNNSWEEKIKKEKDRGIELE